MLAGALGACGGGGGGSTPVSVAPEEEAAVAQPKEHYDIYLAKQLYPVLVPALEELSREISRFTEQSGK